MANLTAKQESFIEMMKKSEEHAAKALNYWLAKQTLKYSSKPWRQQDSSTPAMLPGFVEANEPGYYLVPTGPPSIICSRFQCGRKDK